MRRNTAIWDEPQNRQRKGDRHEMIEIIRQEDAGESYTPRELPKDIKQIGSPDIGDRIYVEDGAYQALHPYDSLEEKRAYVLLGKFENCSGRQCVFVEAVIPLLEMAFDGELPLWNDHTWAYIYKQLKREYDSMVIVGWAMDIKGQLPNMTVRLENLHQSHFGGAHQLLLLMDSLEREEAFYSNRSGHLYRREGFYIYYDKGRAKARTGARRAAEQADEKLHDYKVQSGFAGSISIENGMRGEAAEENREKISQSDGMSFEERMRADEPETEKSGDGLHGSGMSFEERMRTDEPEGKKKEALSGRWIGEGESSGEKERERRRAREAGDEPSWSRIFKGIGTGTGTEPRGEYRKRVVEEEEAKRTPSYASTLLLAMVVCALGVTAFMNHEKMKAMEETLAQMRQTQTISTEEATEQTEGTQLAGMPEVEVETVAGNVKKQDNAATGADGAATSANTDADGADAANGAGTPANTADAAGVAGSGSTAAGSANTEGSTAAGTTVTGGGGTSDGESAANGAGTSANASASGSTSTAGTTENASASGTTNTTGSTAGTGSTDAADSASASGGVSVTGSAAASGNTSETAATTEAQTYLNQGYYVVQKGDSLVGICRKIYQTTAMMDKLCEVNGIEDEDSIYAGQYLTLPN